MKSFTLSLALITLLSLAGCGTPLPKPVQANGAVSPSATVADLDLTYQDAVAVATTYVAQCHAAMTTPGCSDKLIASLKAASTRAKKALHAAHDAVKDFPQGGSGLDMAIAELQAALKFLESYTGQVPTSIATVRAAQ